MEKGSAEDFMIESDKKASCSEKCVIILVGVIVIGVLGATIAVFGIAAARPKPERWQNCTSDECSIVLVESIPMNLTFPAGSPSFVSTYDTWMKLIDLAEESIDIASYYWTLNGRDIYVDPSDKQGENVYKSLLEAGTKRNINIRIAQNKPTKYNLDNDTANLEKAGAAQVRSLDFNKLIGSGILHTKLWLIDRKHAFVGSPNMDWRSLTQVKELAVVFYNCSCVGEDFAKIFEVYWKLGEPGAKIPQYWPTNYSTPYNTKRPMQIKANGSDVSVYFSSSPPQFCPEGRANDIDAILDVMDKAEKFIHIAVMEYYPFMAFSHPKTFWPVIDDKLRSVAYDRGISVRLLASRWKHSDNEMFGFLRSLAVLNTTGKTDIEVKIFVVPASPAQAKIPYARVNHNKYMVTDKHAYIGTSNWSEDYFVSDGGVGAIINQTLPSNSNSRHNGPSSFRQQVADAFQRDWDSDYAIYV